MSVRLGSARTWRIALGVLALLSFAAAIPLSLLSHQAPNLVIAAVIGLPSAAIGVLVTRRQPGNPLGWLFLVSAVCQFIGTDAGGYALLAYHFGHHLPLASVAVALDQIWGPSLMVFAVSIRSDTRAVAEFHRPPGAELAACHRRATPAAEMAGEWRPGQHRLPVPGGKLQFVGQRPHALGRPQRSRVDGCYRAAGVDRRGDPEVPA